MFNKYQLNERVTLRNKVCVAPMTTWSANDDLTVSDQELAYYRLRSKEVGMMITGCTFVNKDYQGFDHQFYGGSDDYIPSLTTLAKVIKDEGAKAILQVFHPGRKGIANNGEVVSASAVKPTNGKKNVMTPRAMTNLEVDQFIENFYQTVIRAIKAGFDGIEIHGANTYLIQQFFSAHTNIRNDKWGGSIENRIKLPLEIVKASLRAKNEYATEEFIIGYRFSPEEIEENGISIKQTLFLVENLCMTDLDYLHVSLSAYDQSSIVDKEDKRIIAKLILEQIKGRKPLIGVGQITDVSDAMKAFELGYDLISIGKAIIVDPLWVSKSKNNVEVEKVLYKDKCKELSIPDKLMKVIENSGDWFTIK